MYQLKIKLAYSDLEIALADVSEVQVTLKNSKLGSLITAPKNIHIDEVDNVLMIQESFGESGFSLKEIGKFITGENKSIFIKVELPRDLAVSEAFIELGAGDLKLNDVKIEQVELHVKAGDIKAEGVEFGSLNAQLSAGDLKVFGKVHEMDAQLLAGDIKLSAGSILSEARLNATMGDVKIELENPEAYLIQHALGLGEIRYKGFEKPITSAVDATKKISVTSKVGDLRIYKSF